MALTQDAILNTLLAAGGKVKNSELMSKFTEPLNCADLAEKKQNRDLFKTFVNNLAVVKEIQETKYIVLRKVYNHLLNSENTQREGETCPEEHKQKNPQDFERNKSLRRSHLSEDAILPGAIETALERSKNVEFNPKKGLLFTIPLKSDIETPKKDPNVCKPYASPVRMPPVNITHHQQNFTEQEENMDISLGDKRTFTDSRREQKMSLDSNNVVRGSPQIQKSFEAAKQSEEPKFALDPTEHEWLVKCATGQWTQVHGLLLKDAHLAEKKDFMSGFTALHWAAKYENTEMVSTIIELSRRTGLALDVNTKSNGGYTPLHIAAIHNKTSIMKLLLHTYAANGNIRDNNGKKPFQYLQKEVFRAQTAILGDHKAKTLEVIESNRDLKNRFVIPNAPATLKKKSKGQMQVTSLGEDGRGERDESLPHKHRFTFRVYH